MNVRVHFIASASFRFIILKTASMSEEAGKVDQSKSNSVQEFSTDLLRVYYGQSVLLVSRTELHKITPFYCQFHRSSISL